MGHPLATRSLLSLLVLRAASTFAGGTVTPADAAKWSEDIRYFAEQAPNVHQNLFHAVTGEVFQSEIATLRRKVPTLTRNQIVVELARIVATIGDGHSYIELAHGRNDHGVRSDGFRHYPLKLYWFPDGVYLLAAARDYAEAVGGKVTRVGKISAQDAYEAVSAIVPHDNEMQLKWLTPHYMAFAEVLDGLGISADVDHLPLTVEKDGREITVTVSAVGGPSEAHGFEIPKDWVDARDPKAPVPLWLKDPNNYYWFEYLRDLRTLYVQYNAVAQKQDETIAVFFKRVMQFAEDNPVDRFVLDLRLNSGGNNYLNLPIIHGFIRSDRVNQRGKLFTIIGRQTFSAAGNCVNALNKNTQTLFVGEPAGARPNSYGDPATVVLPNSKLAVMLSTLWWQDMDPRDKRPWQAPDIAAELTFGAYRAGRDPALDAILGYVAKPGIGEMVRAALDTGDVGAARSAIAAFRADPMNKYLSAERAVNSLGYRYLSEHKLDQAIKVFELNAEEHPQSANVYDSLGEAYMRKGERESAIRNYKKSLELNPKNENARSVLARLEATKK